MPPIARIEPLTTARALRGPFDYRLPPEMIGVEVGSLLVVPFGGRDLLGVVAELAETTDVPPEKLAEPRAVLDPGIPAELVGLARWIADEYCSTPARALGLVLPPGAGRSARPRVRTRHVLVAELTASGRLALALAADGAPLPGDAAPAGARAPRLTPKQHTVLSTLATA
ncbi:MAG TPA: hypothetical protein VLK58_12490, partial [Conexibacter sp.]|nr:hypothetical protein [Conexibacter sp.]